VTNLWLVVLLGAGVALAAGGLVLRTRKDKIAA
jgi:LPXTG-motif cell wall-anchored protein